MNFSVLRPVLQCENVKLLGLGVLFWNKRMLGAPVLLINSYCSPLCHAESIVRMHSDFEALRPPWIGLFWTSSMNFMCVIWRFWAVIKNSRIFWNFEKRDQKRDHNKFCLNYNTKNSHQRIKRCHLERKREQSQDRMRKLRRNHLSAWFHQGDFTAWTKWSWSRGGLLALLWWWSRLHSKNNWRYTSVVLPTVGQSHDGKSSTKEGLARPLTCKATDRKKSSSSAEVCAEAMQRWDDICMATKRTKNILVDAFIIFRRSANNKHKRTGLGRNTLCLLNTLNRIFGLIRMALIPFVPFVVTKAAFPALPFQIRSTNYWGVNQMRNATFSWSAQFFLRIRSAEWFICLDL